MKLHFEPNLDYQLQAIDAVCDLFHGQEICRTEFTVTRDRADMQARMAFAENDLGIGNRLTLLDEELLANLHAIQLRHGLAPSEKLASGDFTVEMETVTSAPVTLDEGDIELPDILTDLQDKTSLTRRSIHRSLVHSGRLDDFKRNPQQFIEFAATIINSSKRMALVDGIKYQRIGAEEYYAQQLFETEELTGYLKSMIDAEKSFHEQVIYQFATERSFAEQLEMNEAIKVYAKLPGWFKVPTPLGPYNPDWAVLVDKDGTERLYFVVETKSSLFTDDLRDKESGKIKCGAAHFAELAAHNSPAAQFIKATNLDDLLQNR